nr:LAGLIDADG family homing endonuclease [Rhodococcus sp. B10]
MRVRTEDLVGNLVRDGARVFRVPNAKPLQLPDAELLLDPYTLGAWLGDGNSDDGRLTGLDVQIWENIELAGHEVRRHKVEKRVGVVGLKATLRRLGVLNNKHIPAEYLRSSEKQRWSLLQGLMDTDGHCDERQGKCEFTTTLSALRDGMLELLASLGIRPKCYSGHATLKGRVTGPKWRIAFSARSDMPVFGLDRKQERLRSPGRGHAQFGHRRIVSVERVETVPTQCLTVAADSHVFLAGREMIPTCNTGKGPWSASMATFEAVGPSQFLGWAGRDDGYACSDYGCSCGWEFPYEPGEPMGMRHPSPVIQLTATNEDQVDNVYRPLTAMIRLGPLSELLFVREGFVRIAGESPGEDFDRIDAVTSSANGRVGNPVSWVLHDESGLYTRSNKMLKVAQDQRRGAAGMNGRTMETTNAWDPAENSTAQQTYESRVTDVFKFYRIPPVGLSWGNKRERRKILKYVYEGSPWVNLDSIEAEALEIGETDPAQAERFFGNRLVYGQGSWLRDGLWNDRYVDAVAS